MENMELIKRDKSDKPFNLFRVIKCKGNYTDTLSVFYADVRGTIRIESKNDNKAWNHPNKTHIEITKDEAKKLAERILECLEENKDE